MSFAAPFGLFALLAVPAVLVLHLFRQVLRKRPVSALFLWAPEALRAQSGRKRSRLMRTASLLLELLAAFFLALWLAGLRVGAPAVEDHVVVVLDDSASMAAERPGGGTVAERVRDEVDALLGAGNGGLLSAGVRVTLVTTGARPQVVVGPRAPAFAAQRALEDWVPRRTGHDPGPALDLARALAEGDDVVFWTDAVPAVVPAGVEVRAVGAGGSNGAVTSVRRIDADDGGETLLVDVSCWGLPVPGAAGSGGRPAPEAVVSAAVSTWADGTIGDPAAAGTEARVAFEPTAGTTGVHRLELPLRRTLRRQAVEVRLELDGDRLPVDDRVVVLPQVDRTVRLARTLPPEAAQRIDLERLTAAIARCEATDDLALADATLGPAPSGGLRHEVVFTLPDGPRDPWIGPYLIDRASPLTEGLTLDGVLWSAGRGELPGRPVVQAGEQALVTLESVRDQLSMHLNLDLAATNLTRAPDWPILLDNFVRLVRRRLPGPVDPHPAVGDAMVWRPPFALRDRIVTLRTPDGRMVRGLAQEGAAGEDSPPDAGERVWSAEQPGLHEVVVDGAVEARFAVRFLDPSESDLTTRSSGRIDPETAGAGPGDSAGADADASGRLERLVLALLALGCVVLDWIVLRRGS